MHPPALASPAHLRLAIALAGCTAVALVAAVPFAALYVRAPSPPDISEWVVVQFAPAFIVSGWWLTSRRPRLALGWLFLVAGLTVTLAGAAAAYAAAAYVEGWPGVDWGLWVFSWLWQPHGALLNVAYLLFPDGTVRSRTQRTFLWLTYAALALAMAISVVHPGNIITTPNKLDGALPGVVNPLGIAAMDGLFQRLDGPLLGLQLVIGLLPVGWVLWQWRRSAGVRRRQFKVVSIVALVGLIAPVAVLGLPGEIGPLVAIGQTLATQSLIVVAILQWRAYEVDVVVRRSVLAGALLAAGLAVYGIVVVVVSLAIGRGGTAVSTTGAAVAIATFGPLSNRIRRAVNRLFYGKRDDPYLVVSESGRRLASASDPQAGLDAVIAELTEQLRLPYAALHHTDGYLLSSSGEPEPGDRPVAVPVIHRGVEVGTLSVGHRRGTTAMTSAESNLLVDLCNQLGPAIAALELIAGLRAAQQRLVVARDEERARIQRDLHDGLGSALTAVTLKLDAARNHLRHGDADAGQQLVGAARGDVQRSLADVRRLVYSLGDPTLRSLGLSAALREQVDSLTRMAHLAVELAIDDVRGLDPHVEEAVFRIMIEAVTNVVRHAEASHCRIGLHVRDGVLHAVVEDDGVGLVGSAARLGREAMAVRAAEIGATLHLADADGQDREQLNRRGTCLRLTLALEERP